MKNFEKIHLLLIILFTIFLSGFGFLYIKVRNFERIITSFSQEDVNLIKTSSNENSLVFDNSCSERCKDEIETKVSQAISTVSANKLTTPQPAQVVTSETKTAYIPLSGPITTTSTGWVDAAGTDVYIDLNSDYGKNAKVSWEAFLKVAHGNGQAFARLYDVTHGISVSGSEISLINIPTSTQVSSGNLSLWAGRNLYRVQIKSLNSFEVTFGSGRIKISY